MTSKKISYLMLFALLVPVILTACGTATATPTEAPATEAMATAAPTEDMGPQSMFDADPTGQTVTFWHAYSSGANLDAITKIVDDFNASNMYGITVEAVAQGSQGDLETAVNGAITTGELPNLTSGFPNGLSRWYGLGVIIGLNDYITDPVYGYDADAYAAIYPGPLANGTLADGTQIGLPLVQSAQVIFYNNTWAQELGFANPPANSAEFKEQACAASEANNTDDNPDNDGTGGLVYYPDASFVSPFIWAFDGTYLNSAGDGYDLNNQAVLDVAVYLKDLVDSGCTLTTPSYPNPEFASRQALFAVSSTAGIPFQRSAMDDAGSTDEWSPIPFVGPNGTQVVDAFGQMVGIVGTNPEQDLASWIFLKYLTSAEAQTTWVSMTGYYPTQPSTDVSSKADDVQWNEGLALLPLGVGEPNLPAHGAVRSLIRDAFFAILDATDDAGVQAVLDQLNTDAADAVAESQ
jgi:multiple sugar transport system substrate-binding protein/sn-glycerol 3-phosphate transport system substrate-binding protein